MRDNQRTKNKAKNVTAPTTIGGPKQRFALFSVNEMKDIVEFAKVLNNNNWVIIATEAAYDLLKKNKTNVIPVSEFVGNQNKYKFPPTLHPKMEAALTDDDFPRRIELVYDITYGPEEGFDVGGNTLLALAIKGKRIPVISHMAMKSVVDYMAEFGELTSGMRNDLILEAMSRITDYYIRVAQSISQNKQIYLNLKWHSELLNGENPYQKADLWGLENQDSLALVNYRLISDNKPCYTNMADLNSITETITKLSLAFRLNCSKQPFIAVASKHGNACGIGVDWQSKEIAIEKALWANPLAIWGGEVVVNFKLDTKESQVLVSSEKREKLFGKAHWMLDIIAAPEVKEQALPFLLRRKNTKLFVNKSLFAPALSGGIWDYRFIRAGVIRQSIPEYILDASNISWNIPQAASENLDDILIAWAAAFTSFHGGNEVALSCNRQLISCAGGPSTVDAAETAVTRAIKLHGRLENVAFAADAFFPFTDAPEILANSGVVSGVVPSGGLKHNEVRDFFTSRKIRVGFIPEEFRGFCRH